MGNCSTKNGTRQRFKTDSDKLFQRRTDYRLEQGFSETEALRLAQLKAEIDAIKYNASAQSKFSKPSWTNAEIVLPQRQHFDDFEPTPDQIAKEISQQIQLGRMSLVSESARSNEGAEHALTSIMENILLTSSAIKIRESSSIQQVENSPTAQSGNSPDDEREISHIKYDEKYRETIFSFVLSVTLYLATAAILIPATALVFGDNLLGWTSAIVLDVSIGIAFSMIFEEKDWRLSALWAVLMGVLLYNSFNTLDASSTKISTEKSSEIIEKNLEVKNLRARIKRLNDSYEAIPLDQITNRRKTNAELTMAEDLLSSKIKEISSSPEVQSVEHVSSATLWTRGILLLLSMLFMHGVRRGFADPKVMEVFMGRKN